MEKLYLGMPIDLDDSSSLSRYGIRAVMNPVCTPAGRVFRQFSYGEPDPVDFHFHEGIESNGVVDSLMTAWVYPVDSEDSLQQAFSYCIGLFSRQYDEYSPRTLPVDGLQQRRYDGIDPEWFARFEHNTARVIHHAIISKMQSGVRPMVRVIFIEGDDTNTILQLELNPVNSTIQYRVTKTLRK